MQQCVNRAKVRLLTYCNIITSIIRLSVQHAVDADAGDGTVPAVLILLATVMVVVVVVVCVCE